MLILILLITPILATLIALIIKAKLKAIERLAFISAGLQLVISLIIAKLVVQTGAYGFLPYFQVDSLTAILITVTSLVGFAAVAYNVGYVRQEIKKEIIGLRRARQSYFLISLFLLAMFLAITTTSPIITWIAIEATTLSTVFLISFYNKPTAIEAAWKYLVINSVGLMLAFMGTVIYLASATPFLHGNFITWQNILLVSSNLDPNVIKMAFVFLLIGYGTKVGLAPMHSWLPDAHSQAPSPISAVLSGALLNIALLPILRFKIVTDIAVGGNFTQHLFIFFGVMSIILAAFAIFRQESYKRLLAYSSIEHEAVILLGFGFGGIGVYAALLHMIYHSLAKSSMFLLSGNILLKYGSAKIKNVKNMVRLLPKTGILFIIGFLALTGIPPFGLFMTEFYMLLAGAKNYLWIIVIIMLALALVFLGFFRQTSNMIFGKATGDIKEGEFGKIMIIPPAILLGILIVLSVFIPSDLQKLLSDAMALFK